MPFTSDQFFAVFRAYNEAVWPAQWLLAAAGALALGAALSRRPAGGRAAYLLLGALWLWMAVAYHLAFFAAINPAASLFAALFAVAAGLFFRQGLRTAPPRLAVRGGWRRNVGLTLALYGLAVYPLLNPLFGHRFPAAPGFGLPCPTTLFTLGVLSLAPPGPGGRFWPCRCSGRWSARQRHSRSASLRTSFSSQPAPGACTSRSGRARTQRPRRRHSEADMNGIDKIVIGTSLASESDAVVDAGVALAKASGAAVELVHALPSPVDLYPGAPALGEDWFLTLEAELRERLDAQAAARGLDRVRHVRRVELGSPHQVLLACAAAAPAGLIVLGAAVGGTPRRRLLGSTADRLLRKASCPVLVVRPGCAMPPARVLLATDLSPTAAGVLRRGLEVALPGDGARPDVEVLFVHTVGSETSVHFTREQMHRFAEEELWRVARAALPDGPLVRCNVRQGYVAEEILAEAESWKPDLLVVGTHGASGLERALLGSVAAQLVRDAPGSVLVVPLAAAAEERGTGADWVFVPDAESSIPEHVWAP